jgi:CHASE1-domain containing sensor protein
MGSLFLFALVIAVLGWAAYVIFKKHPEELAKLEQEAKAREQALEEKVKNAVEKVEKKSS